MTDWAAFAGFTGVVLVALLSLAHLSRGIPHGEGVDQTPATGSDDAADAPARPDDAGDGDPTGASSETADPALDATELSPDVATESNGAVAAGEPARRTGFGLGIEVDFGDEAGRDHRDGVGQNHRDGADQNHPDGVGHGRQSERHAPADEARSTPRETAPATDVPPTLLLANVAFSQALLAGVLVLGAWYAAIPPAALGLSPSGLPSEFGLGVALGVGLYAANRAGSSLSEHFGLLPDESLREALTPETRAGWVLLFGVALPLVAGFEELLFRGALVGAAAAGFGVSPWLMASLSSVAFGVGHGAQGRVGVVVTGLLGFVLAAAFVLTGSLVVVVVAHYLVNALEFVGAATFDW